MSGPIDETFTDLNLVPGTVLEFGVSPGIHTSRRSQRHELQITGVDLYMPHTVEGFKFIQGDLMDMNFQEQFDNVACVSSLEHCGIESLNYQEGYEPDWDYYLVVAEKIKSLVKPGGRLVITCPFGADETYLVDNEGHTFRPFEESDYTPKWGYRVFSLMCLKSLLNPMRCIKASAFRCVGKDYFDINAWVQIDENKDHVLFHDRASNRAVIGTVFVND
ncbi:hypothetical protein LCGC14_0747470 [marine sediment metagenome]|uniref:Methyltransferase type 11 domain-containing protein n=1 Tax=marine sediment metagenome TaxID=412755 RepID=A0A0F9TBY9_9ZZZZ